MLDCFDNVVGLTRSCVSPYEVSPVMSLESFGVDETMIAQFIGVEDTVASLVHEAQQHARAVIQSDVLARYASRIIPRTFLHSQRVGEPDEHQTLVTGATGRAGILVEVRQPQANTRLTLSGLRLYAAATGTIDVTIYDLSDGSTVDTISIDATIDTITTALDTITIELPRRTGIFFIAHDSTSWRVQRIGAGCASCVGGKLSFGGVVVSGASLPASAPLLRSNLRTGVYTGGLSVIVDVACDHTQYLCEHRSLLISPYATKVVEIILRRGINAVERINSQRVNLELLKERADRAAEEYAAAMSNLLGGMLLPGDGVCFSCTKYARVVTSAP